LDNVNTETHVARALAVSYEHLGINQRARIEAAIVELPEHRDNDRPHAEARRDELLSCLPEELLATDDARRLRPATLTPSGWLTDENELAMWGAESPGPEGRKTDVGPDTRAELEALVAPVRALTAAQAEVMWEQAVEGMQALRDGLGRLEVEDHVRDSAFGALTYACVRAAARVPLPNDRASALAADVLLEAAEHSLPVGADQDEDRDGLPSWGHPAPRIDAARGLCLLARVPAGLTPDAVDVLRTLAQDRASVVRMHVAEAAHWLRDVDSGAMWSIVEQVAVDDRAAVLHHLMDSLGALAARDDRDRALELAYGIYEREMARAKPRELVEAPVVALLVECWALFGSPQGAAVVEHLAANISACARPASAVFFRLRTLTTRGEVAAGDADDKATRQRALHAWTEVTHAAVEAFERTRQRLLSARVNGAERDLQDDVAPSAAEATQSDPVGSARKPELGGIEIDPGDGTELSDRPSGADPETLKALGKVLNAAAAELYFGSGAYHRPDGDTQRLDLPRRRRFYQEASAFIDVAVEIGIPRAAHHVVETLEQSIDFDPRGVLLRTGRVLRAAGDWGYQHDSLAIALFVRLTQRCLAEHRELLADRDCRAALLGALDLFVEAGWPDARRLVYRLDDAFR
jgi:hypothetical protein